MNRALASLAVGIVLVESAPAMAQAIHCTQEGLWSARCADSRGNVVGGDLSAKDGNLLTFGRGDASRCGVDAAGMATCGTGGTGGKSLGSADLLGPARTGDAKAKAKPQSCTSNGLGVTHCTDGGIIGQKCVSDGMGGTRCGLELRGFGSN